MQALRFPRFWWALGWLLVAGISIGSLMPSQYVPGLSVGDKFLHASAYGLLMLWFGGLYRRERHWLIGLGAFALGIALDVAQSGTATRHFDLLDVAANASGILAALVLLRIGLDGWCLRVERLFKD